MAAMKAKAEEQLGKDETVGDLRSPWKWTLRKRVWDYMEENDIARFPRPVHHRIPNFVGADKAANNLAQLPEFQAAKMVKVNPDTPQRPVRHAVLQQKKTLLTPQPRLRTGFFSTIDMSELPSLVEIEQCTNSKGVVKYGTRIRSIWSSLEAQRFVPERVPAWARARVLPNWNGGFCRPMAIWMRVCVPSSPPATTVRSLTIPTTCPRIGSSPSTMFPSISLSRLLGRFESRIAPTSHRESFGNCFRRKNWRPSRFCDSSSRKQKPN